MSSNGRCFDIGNTVYAALDRYLKGGSPFAGSSDPESAGNGSIMRLAPVVLFYYPDPSSIFKYSIESSRTTHGTQECLDACALLGEIIRRALDGKSKDETTSEIAMSTYSEGIRALANGEWRDKEIKDIRGSGYVVESLEAALWCFWHGNTFEESIFLAANLGDDADTTAAICGQIAGAFYGLESIPKEWRNRITMSEEIIEMAKDLYAA